MVIRVLGVFLETIPVIIKSYVNECIHFSSKLLKLVWSIFWLLKFSSNTHIYAFLPMDCITKFCACTCYTTNMCELYVWMCCNTWTLVTSNTHDLFLNTGCFIFCSGWGHPSSCGSSPDESILQANFLALIKEVENILRWYEAMLLSSVQTILNYFHQQRESCNRYILRIEYWRLFYFRYIY